MEFKTLNQFILERQAEFPFASGELSRLLSDIALAAKVVNRAVNKAGLADILGEMEAFNPQGEQQQKLDVLADELFVTALRRGKECCVIASEEHEQIIDLTHGGTTERGKYIVCIDPLDGSSNIDVNVSVGTIFSIYRNTSTSTADTLQSGRHQVAAGYVLYGSSTMLVYTTGYGVNGFTLDPSIGEFCLSHPQLIMPKDGDTYAINEGNYTHFPAAVKMFIKYCQEEDSNTRRPYSSRYVGSLVADVHRILLKGGVFIYPKSARYPQGKLRLMYECNPMAFIVEQAGGCATTGVNAVLDRIPTQLHERCALILGSYNLVEKVTECYRQQLADELIK